MSNRIEYISLASVISTIAVVFLHVNSCFWNFSPTFSWMIADIIESVFYFAVPVFFMISGAMLLDFNKKYGVKKYFQKRISKTLIPYIVWSITGLIFQIYYVHSIKPRYFNLEFIINGLLNGSLVRVYWFFIPLFCIYLLIPLFAHIADDKKKELFIYSSVMIFILNLLIAFKVNLSYAGSISLAGQIIFYPFVGYLLHKYELSKNQRIVLYILAILGLFLHLGGTYYLSIQANTLIQTFKGYTNVACILYSVGVFVFIKYGLVGVMDNEYINKLVHIFDYYTFGVYLIHWFIIKIIVMAFAINNSSIIYRLVAPFLVFIISVVIIYIIRKIPLLKHIVP